MDGGTLEVSNPILITGAARSGTSMTAGIIAGHGVWGGEVAGPTRYNRRGMFENCAIRNGIVKPYLMDMRADPMGQFPLPDINNLRPFPRLRDSVLQALRVQGHTGQRWYYKGAKMCLVWPTWVEAFPEAKWVLIRRDPDEITNSCMKTGFMRAYDCPDGWMQWVEEHLKRFEEMKAAGLQLKEVWPMKFIQGDTTELQGVIEWLELDWDLGVVKEFVDPQLWSGKNGK